MRNILALGRTIFIYGSAVGFWYIVIPTHITSMIVTMVSYGILGGIGFLIIGNIFFHYIPFRINDNQTSDSNQAGNVIIIN